MWLHCWDKNQHKRFHFLLQRFKNFINNSNNVLQWEEVQQRRERTNEFYLIQLFWNLHKTLLDSCKSQVLRIIQGSNYRWLAWRQQKIKSIRAIRKKSLLQLHIFRMWEHKSKSNSSQTQQGQQVKSAFACNCKN